MAYHLKHVGVEIDNLLDKADTALQEHQDISYLATKDELSSGLTEDRNKIKELGEALETEVSRATNAEKELSDKIDKKVSDLIDSAPETLDTLRELADALQDSDSAFNKALNNKVDKVSGKGLSTNDFTSAEKNKLASLQNYDDTQVKKLISQKQDIISDLDTIRDGASKGATALQSYTEKYQGTVTSVKINGTTKNPSNGVVDLGSVITSHQDISGKQDKLVSGQNIKTINGEDILGSGDITIKGGGGSVDVLLNWEDYDSETMQEYALSAKLGNELYSMFDGVDSLLDEINGESIQMINEINGEII